MTGEEEDTDVGFPGPGHFIAEREMPMKVAMSALAVQALVGGLVQIPGVDADVSTFLAPTFADSHLAKLDPSTGSAWLGLAVGALIAVIAIFTAYRIWVVKPATAPALQNRFSAVHSFLVNKWYFDEAIDFVVVRPTQWIGRFADSVLERGLIAGALTGGTVGVVRACSAIVRRAQTGFLRYYAAAIVVGLFAVSLYFLIASS